METGAPNSAATSAVLSANSNISTAFGASPVFFSMGELGGAHSTSGTTAQTVTSEIDLTVDLTKLSVRHDLLVGLYNGTSTGSGFSSMSFDIYADGTDITHQTFTTLSAAKAYFTNHAIDLGSLSSGGLSGATLTLRAVMSVSENSAGSSFQGGLIFGDPPPTTTEHATLVSHQILGDMGASIHSVFDMSEFNLMAHDHLNGLSAFHSHDVLL